MEDALNMILLMQETSCFSISITKNCSFFFLPGKGYRLRNGYGLRLVDEGRKIFVMAAGSRA